MLTAWTHSSILDPGRWAVHEEEVVDTEDWAGRRQEAVMTQKDRAQAEEKREDSCWETDVRIWPAGRPDIEPHVHA